MTDIDIIDIGKIQAEIEKIKKDIEKRDKEIESVTKEIEKLEEKQAKLQVSKKDNVFKQFSELEQRYTVTKDIKKRIDDFAKAMDRVIKTKKDIKALYMKAFKRITNERITVPMDVFSNFVSRGYGGDRLTIYPRGFGLSYGEDYPSKFIDDWATLKEIFEHPDIAEYIPKSDKRDMFYAFAEAVSNWIDIPVEDSHYRVSRPLIELRCSAPYVAIKESGYGDEISIKHTQIHKIVIERTTEYDYENRNYYDTFKINFETSSDHYSKTLDKLKFGEIYALAHVWEQLGETITEKISHFISVAENNETVLKQLKQAISTHLMVDEL